MREIKFRGKRLDNGEWIYGGLLQSNKYELPCKCAYMPSPTLTGESFWKVLLDYEVDPATVGQYTGLTDKNGKEIYEGDIVTEIDIVIAQNRRRYQVVFETGATRIGGLILARYYNNDDRLAKRYVVEVIGNIHDNPELLKGGEK